jgi:L-fuconolactonase
LSTEPAGLQAVDTHIHLWDTRRFRYPWLKDLPKLDRPYLPADYRLAVEGLPISRMVFMQCETEPAQSLEEARWAAGLAAEEPRLSGIIPWAPLENGERARPFLEELAEIPLVKGVRRIIQYEADPEFCLSPDFIRGVQLLPEYGWSFDLCISHGQLKNTIQLVRRCPRVSFILDHIGKPAIRSRLRSPWEAELRELARLPNVACKMSGLVTEADPQHWRREDLRPYIEQVLDCFGFQRIVYGGDWPVLTLAAEYRQWWEALAWALDDRSAGERKLIYQDNAVRLYRLQEEGRQ